MKKKQLINGSIILLLSLITISSISFHMISKLKSENRLLQVMTESLSEEIDLHSNEKISLEDFILKQNKENENLIKKIVYLKSKKQEIKFITKVKYETKEIETIIEKLPDSFLFKTEYGLPVCLYSAKNNQYSFTVLSVEYEASIINTKETSHLELIAHSEYSREKYIVPISDIHVSNVSEPDPKEKIYIEPHIGIGLYADTNLDIRPSLNLTAIHYKDFDFGKIDITLSENPKLGLAPIAYNIGSNIPIITDTWISVGISTDLSNKYFYIGLSSKF